MNHKHTAAKVVGPFFKPNGYEKAEFPNDSIFNWNGLKGRLLSSSYTPEPGHAKHVPMLEALNSLFTEYQTDGKVAFQHTTVVYYGQISS